MDFHEQRARDLIRAESRPRANEIARNTRGLLDRYVSSRRMQANGETVTQVLWGRILAVAGVVGLAVLGVAHALR